MKKVNLFVLEILLFYSVVVDAAVTREDPFISIGTDFLILTPGNDNHVIKTWFNNTNIYLDLEDDGVWDFKYTKNSGEDLAITHLNPDLIKPGTRIHADKPVEYSQYFGLWGVVPEIRNLKKEYYVDNTPEKSTPYYGGPCGYYASHYSHRPYYVAVPQNSNEITTIYADYMNGTVTSINVSHLSRGIVQGPIHCGNYQPMPMRIYSNREFYLYDGNGVIGPAGNDFYLPWQNIQKLVIIKNDTEVRIDKNNDMNYDMTIINDSGIYGSFSLAHGSHIHSNNPIAVFTDWGYYALPSNMTGNDIWSRDLSGWNYCWGSWQNCYNIYNNILGLFESTNLNFDRIKENDLSPDFNFTINQNEYRTINSKIKEGSRFHIYADKPFIEISDNNNGVFPYSSISATQQSRQKYLGANEVTTIEVRIFNPFANTIIHNLTATIRFPHLFFWLNESVVIEKRYIMNDAIVENSTFVVTPADYQFSMNLSILESMQYYDIEYQLRTPLQIGSFEFEPVTISYEADTWNMPQ